MRHILQRTLFSVFFVLAIGCASKPILNVEGSPVPTGKKDSVITNSIKGALAYKRWQVIEESKNTIMAKISVRSHSATIKITYDKKAYSINYVESKNLKHNPGNNTIHRNYNRWVNNLNVEIQKYLASLN